MPRLLNLLITALTLCLVVSTQSAMAQEREPSREPVLRVETRMHTSTIRRIGVDAANRFLVTASDDKTVRVWELPSARLVRIIRVPINTSNDGRLYGVAISPDGSTIAAGGWTGFEWENAHSIYLFDRESGRLIRRLGGLPNVINHLVYSPDGRYLAATLGGKNGVRLYSTATYTLAAEDKDYSDDSYCADFDRAGKLVTASWDGFIRLYATGLNGSLRLLAKQRAVGGDHPFDVKFSPDGARIAFGFSDTSKVAVLQASDLAPLYSPDTTGVSNGNLGRVAWSADGRILYAGGRAMGADNKIFIRTWTDGGRGTYRDITGAAEQTIFHIIALRDGGMIYGAADPAFGVIDANGRRQLFTSAAIADYRGIRQSFLLSNDGNGISFGYEFGKSPASFSLTDRKLDVTPGISSNWRAPQTDDSSLQVTDWRDGYEPRFNGTPLKLEQYEFSRSLALAPDRSSFLLGTEWNLRLYDRSGAVRWRVAAPGIAWAINISGDGKLAVSAYSDGTIRWYSMTDGKELLAFFPHNDRKRWILWTPSGYYDASPGAEDLIGWHVNNGRDAAADFFPVGQFRSTYYRPDVIAKVLQTGDEARALALANEEAGRSQQQANVSRMLPPVVEIVSPTESSTVSSTEITVRFRVRSPSGERVTNIRALVDGRPVSGARDLVQQGSESDTRDIRVTIPERDSQVSIIAENQFAASVPATVRLRWQAAVVTRPEAFIIKPRLYILAVGVSRYANPKFKLNFADKDARDFVGAMMTQKGLLYRDVVIYHDKALTNEEATKDEVLDGLDWIRKETTSNDVAMVFFSGHGVNDQNSYYYFAPYNIDPDRLLRTGVTFSDIKNTVSAIAGKALFFVDTCHSGNSLGLATRKGPLDINLVINELSSAQNGAVVFSASTGGESSFEREEWNNGAFTKALVEGLNGLAAIGNTGRITYNMLNIYISERVKELTKGTQHPTMVSPQTVPDFPVAVKR